VQFLGFSWAVIDPVLMHYGMGFEVIENYAIVQPLVQVEARLNSRT